MKRRFYMGAADKQHAESLIAAYEKDGCKVIFMEHNRVVLESENAILTIEW